jgi:hypothetical protein
MAKKRSDEDEQVIRDEASAQEAYAGTAQGQREATMDERVAAAIGQHPEPVETPEPTAAAQFLVEAREAQAVFAKGDPISPDVLKGLVSRAVGLVAASEETATKA